MVDCSLASGVNRWDVVFGSYEALRDCCLLPLQFLSKMRCSVVMSVATCTFSKSTGFAAKYTLLLLEVHVRNNIPVKFLYFYFMILK